MGKYIYLLTTTPASHTHRFHPHRPPANHTHRFHPLPLATPIHSTHSPQSSSILLTAHVQQEAGVASGFGWNLWVWLAGGGCGRICRLWLVGVVVRRYIHFLILLIPTPLLICSFLQQHTYFLFIFLNIFLSCSCTFLKLNYIYLKKIGAV